MLDRKLKPWLIEVYTFGRDNLLTIVVAGYR